MEGDLLEIWKSIDSDLIDYIDNMSVTVYWDGLIPYYVLLRNLKDYEDISSRLRSVLVMMRTMMLMPTILQDDIADQDVFGVVANQFVNAYIKSAAAVEIVKDMIRDMLLDYATIIGDCPAILKEKPVSFLHALGRAICSMPYSKELMSGESMEDLISCSQCIRFYALLCEVSYEYAFLVADAYPLLPSRLSGDTLESAPFLPHLFAVLPTLLAYDETGQLEPSLLDRVNFHPAPFYDGITLYIGVIQDSIVTILRTWLFATAESRDYLLTYLACLVASNRAKVGNPFAVTSSTGLLINLAISLLVLLHDYLRDGCCPEEARKLFLYLMSDSARAQLTRPGPYNAKMKYEHRLWSVLAPNNRCNRKKSKEEWWTILKYSRAEFEANEAIEAVEAVDSLAPRSSWMEYAAALQELRLLGTGSATLLQLKPVYDEMLGFPITAKHPTPFFSKTFQSKTCDHCGKTLQELYYQCLNCSSYCICLQCYEEEKADTILTYIPPLPEETLQQISRPGEKGEHDALHHFFAEIQYPILPIDRVLPFTPIDCIPIIPPSTSDSSSNDPYRLFSAADCSSMALCTCRAQKEEKEQKKEKEEESTTSCPVHGILTRRSYAIDAKVYPTLASSPPSGFCFSCKCHYCHSSIVGTVYHCLQCSLDLCEYCYRKDILIGGGLPSHQINHVFILLYHPYQTDFFCPHHRRDSRSVPHATTLYHNEAILCGITLNTLALHEKPQNNLFNDLLMLCLRFMDCSVLYLYGVLPDISNELLPNTKQVLSILFNYYPAFSTYLYLTEFLSYAILLLITLITPEAFPLDTSLHLFSTTTKTSFMNSIHLPPFEKKSCKLRSICLYDVSGSGELSAMLEVTIDPILVLLKFYIAETSKEDLVNSINNGDMDYTLLLLVLLMNPSLSVTVIYRFMAVNIVYSLFSKLKQYDNCGYIIQIPVIRQQLYRNCPDLFLSTTHFEDRTQVPEIQSHINKIMLSLFRNDYSHGYGFEEMASYGENAVSTMKQYIHEIIREGDKCIEFVCELLAVYIEIKNTAYDANVKREYKYKIYSNLEYIKNTVNIFLRIIEIREGRHLLLQTYLLKRFISYLLNILNLLASPLILNNLAFLTAQFRFHFAKWLSVLFEEVYIVVTYAPSIDTIDESIAPSILSIYEESTKYKNVAYIGFVSDDMYKQTTFESIYNFCSSQSVLEERKLKSFRQIINRLEKYEEHIGKLSQAIEDCPDEFRDALMDTLMSDPVILPSGNRCDRYTVQRMVLDSPFDPFTRNPMTIDDVKPDIALKARIVEYLKSIRVD